MEKKHRFSSCTVRKKNRGGSPEERLTLAELPVGTTATIIKVVPNSRGSRKFADVGLVAGTELLMEAHAPFGGLMRVKILGTSMALHRSDAANIILKNK